MKSCTLSVHCSARSFHKPRRAGGREGETEGPSGGDPRGPRVPGLPGPPRGSCLHALCPPQHVSLLFCVPYYVPALPDAHPLRRRCYHRLTGVKGRYLVVHFVVFVNLHRRGRGNNLNGIFYTLYRSHSKGMRFNTNHVFYKTFKSRRCLVCYVIGCICERGNL